MPPRTSPADERLKAAYVEAALRLERALADAGKEKRAVILSRIDAMLNQVDEITREYITNQLPAHFRRGSEEAVSELRKIGVRDIDQEFTQQHKEALQQIANEASQNFGASLIAARRSADGILARAEKQRLLNEILISEIEGVSNPAEQVKKVLEKQGITALRSGNRTWTLENYASMLTETITAEAHNMGAMTRYMSNGIEYARRIERVDACPICRGIKDKIIWLGDRRLIPPSHPHCRGGISPVQNSSEEPIRSPDDMRLPEVTRDALLKL